MLCLDAAARPRFDRSTREQSTKNEASTDQQPLLLGAFLELLRLFDQVVDFGTQTCVDPASRDTRRSD